MIQAFLAHLTRMYLPQITDNLYIVVASFIGGGFRSTWRKPLTCCKSLTNFIT
jgi:hypothetical protein